MAGKFVIFKDKKDEWRFNLKAGNGRVIAVSEGYKKRDGAINGAVSVIMNAEGAMIVDEKNRSIA